jgi:hypothetical protein
VSSYKSLNLFGSGPHRFGFGRQGHLVTLDFFNGFGGGGSTAQGPIDLEIVVSGRLVAVSEGGLWNLRDAIRGQINEPPVPGTLVDSAGRSWLEMTLVRYEEGVRRDRGRVYSMRYTAVFKRLTGL